MIKIAHRLNTIVKSDVIAVLHSGKVVEMGDPARLLADKGSFFYNLFHDQKLQAR